MELSFDTLHVFPRMSRALSVWARDSIGRDEDAGDVEFSVSDPSIAEVSGKGWTWMLRDSTAIRRVHAGIDFLRPGRVTVEARLGNAIGSVTLSVLPNPPISTALVVDSFAVFEYSHPYGTVYSPVIFAREPSGVFPVELIAFGFEFSGLSTGFERCTLRLGPSQARYLSGPVESIYDFPGVHDPEHTGPVVLRLLIVDGAGKYGRVETTAPIQPMGPLPNTAMVHTPAC